MLTKENQGLKQRVQELEHGQPAGYKNSPPKNGTFKSVRKLWGLCDF